MENSENNSAHKLSSVERFNEMLFKKKSFYFDVDEFEEIVDYYNEKQDWVKALDAIDYSKKLHPFTPFLLLKEADLLGATGQHDTALNLINRVELIEPENADLFLIKGSLLAEINKSEKAITAYKRGAELSQEELDEIYVSIAFEYQNIEKFTNAIEYLRKALEINANNEDALYELGYCFDRIDEPNKMVNFLQSFIDENPYCDYAWNLLGSNYLRQKNYNEAITAFDYAIVIDEKYTTAYFNKASALIAMEKHKQAIKIYEQVIDFDITGSLAYHQIGYCNEQLDNINKAIVFYNKATKIDEDFAESWLSLARLYSLKGKHMEAIYAAKKALENGSKDIEYLTTFAQIQGTAGLIEEAKNTYKKALEKDDLAIQTWIKYADLLFNNNLFNEAIETITEGLTHNSNSADLYYRLVAYFISKGEETEAEDMLHQALTIDFNKHTQLFEFMPLTESNTFILDLIDSFSISQSSQKKLGNN